MEDCIEDALWISTIMSKSITCSFLVLILHKINLKKKYLNTAVLNIKKINIPSKFMFNINTANMKDKLKIN